MVLFLALLLETQFLFSQQNPIQDLLSDTPNKRPVRVPVRRSALTGALFDQLMEAGYPDLDEPERLALAGDLEGLTASGDVPAAITMKLLPKLLRMPTPLLCSGLSTTAKPPCSKACKSSHTAAMTKRNSGT